MPTCPIHAVEKPCRHCPAPVQLNPDAPRYVAPHLRHGFVPAPVHQHVPAAVHQQAPRRGQRYAPRRPQHAAPRIEQSARRTPPHLQPRRERRAPPTRGHCHGNQGPYKIRCGANEGLCVLNGNHAVECLFTDGLVGCTQVIFRNHTATFTCHILVGAPDPAGWVSWALAEFESEYGAVQQCWVATGDGSGATQRIFDALKHRKPVLLARSGGYYIDIKTGQVKTTPSMGFSATRQDVAGWQTGRGLVDLRLRGSISLGTVQVGDYCEMCDVCRANEERW